MWRAVIMQAFEDIFAKDYWIQRNAISWLFKDNKDFNMVCDFADLSPKKVRMKAFEKIVNGRYYHKTLGQQKQVLF